VQRNSGSLSVLFLAAAGMKAQIVYVVILVIGLCVAFEERSLAIIFDGTGSMGKDLEQLKSAAKKIIDNLSMQEKNHIADYILVVYRDPG
jgi:hypothetical protein